MNFYQEYSDALYKELSAINPDTVDDLVQVLFTLWQNHGRLFICGNGGSAANALHLANDFSYGVNPTGRAIDVEALPSNTAVTTCLANDTGYDNIFAGQLSAKARPHDVLLVLSGSGNSANIVNALQLAKKLEMTTCAIVGYSGGKAKDLADIVIHSPINDMQIAEDIQVIIGHWLSRKLMPLLKVDGK